MKIHQICRKHFWLLLLIKFATHLIQMQHYQFSLRKHNRDWNNHKFIENDKTASVNCLSALVEKLFENFVLGYR